jgi:hypothetical protein
MGGLAPGAAIVVPQADGKRSEAEDVRRHHGPGRPQAEAKEESEEDDDEDEQDGSEAESEGQESDDEGEAKDAYADEEQDEDEDEEEEEEEEVAQRGEWAGVYDPNEAWQAWYSGSLQSAEPFIAAASYPYAPHDPYSYSPYISAVPPYHHLPPPMPAGLPSCCACCCCQAAGHAPLATYVVCYSPACYVASPSPHPPSLPPPEAWTAVSYS